MHIYIYIYIHYYLQIRKIIYILKLRKESTTVVRKEATSTGGFKNLIKNSTKATMKNLHVQGDDDSNEGEDRDF